MWLCLRLLHFLLLQLPHNFSLTFSRLAGIILIPAETLPWRSGQADMTPLGPLPPRVGPRSTRNRGTGHQLLLKDRPPCWPGALTPTTELACSLPEPPHSGAWLQAWPITACCLRLDDEAIRVAVGLRLGVSLCTPTLARVVR